MPLQVANKESEGDFQIVESQGADKMRLPYGPWRPQRVLRLRGRSVLRVLPHQ